MKARICQRLLQRAEQGEEQAQRHTAVVQTQEQGARATLQDLLRYQREFDTRPAPSARLAALDNGSRFAQRLEQAARSQLRTVGQAQARSQLALDALRRAQQDRQRLEHLLAAEQGRARQRAQRTEQKLTDEAAQRSQRPWGAT